MSSCIKADRMDDRKSTINVPSRKDQPVHQLSDMLDTMVVSKPKKENLDEFEDDGFLEMDAEYNEYLEMQKEIQNLNKQRKKKK